MKSLFRSVAIACWLCVLPANAWSAGLTEAQVRGTLGALQELEQEFGEAREARKPGADFGAFAQGQDDLARALAILQRHGFAGLEAWSEVSQRVVNAYMAAKLAEEQPGMAEEMARTRAEIEASDMPAEQKRQMLALLEQSLASMQALADAPAEDLAAVRALLPELDAYFGE